jgi:hypothetical protein
MEKMISITHCRIRKTIVLGLLATLFANNADAMIKLLALPCLLLSQEQAFCLAGALSLVVKKFDSPGGWHTLNKKILLNKFQAREEPIAQQYAKQCFEKMSQLAQEGKIDWLKNKSFKNRDESVTLSVYSLPFPLTYSGAIGLFNEHKSKDGWTDEHTIKINALFWKKEQGDDSVTNLDALSDSIKRVICHEVAHAWLQHAKNDTPDNQCEYEAESLTVITLHAMHEKKALVSVPFQSIALSFLADHRILGCINGMSYTQNQDLRLSALETAKQKKTLKLGYKSQQELVAMIPYWQPKESYEDAVQQKRELLSTWRPGCIFNLNNVLRAPFFAGGAYWLYKNRNWLCHRPLWQLAGALGLAFVATKPITTYRWIVGLPQTLKSIEHLALGLHRSLKNKR